jgi:hypothetical protein
MHTPTHPPNGGARSVSARLRDERFAAEYLGLSLSTLRRMRRKRLDGGAGPEAGPAFTYIMSAVRYDRQDLDRYVDGLPRPGGGQLAQIGGRTV